MSNRAQEIIKTFYEEEARRQESEITYSDYTVRLNTSDIAMLDVIAKRFGKAAERVASDAVTAAIYSMVEALETSERKTMAKEADDLNETLAKKAAKANGKPDFDEKSVTWVMNDRAITREENKRKKELEEQQAREAKQQKNKIEATPEQASEQASERQNTSDDAPESGAGYAQQAVSHNQADNSIFNS